MFGMTTRLRALWFIAVATLILVTSCGGSSEGTAGDESATDESTLVFANVGDLRDLNPHLYSGEIFAKNLLFESLVRITADGSFEPWLAESYAISEDGRTYTFTLRQDVQFSDGTPFNAEAAKANFDALLDNAARHTWLESIRLMQAVDAAGGTSVEATGEYELVLRLAEPYYPLLVELGVTRPYRFVSPAAFIDGTTKDGLSGLIGTGPYVLQEHRIDEYSVFVANESYWGAQPEIETVIVRVIPENQARVLALEAGEVDLIFGSDVVDTETYNRFSTMDGFGTTLSDPVATRLLLMNTTDEILGDVRVRRAVSHATDRAGISEGLFAGIEPPAGTVFAPTIPYADVGLEAYAFDRDAAARLLDEAGWRVVEGETYRRKDGQELLITFHYSTGQVTDRVIAEYLQSEYRAVGIRLDIEGEEHQAYRDRMRAGDFQFTFDVSWGTPYDPQSFLGSMRNPVYGDYAAQLGLENKAELDQAILDALTSVDEGARQEHYRYILTTLHDGAVYLPLTYERNRAIYSDRVGGVSFNPSKFEVPIERMSVR